MLKESVSVLLLRRLFDIFSQGEDWESCGGFSWRDLLEKPDDLYDCELETRTDVSAVLVVLDVPVSPSSVVTECCDGICGTAVLFFLQKSARWIGRIRRKR